MLWTEVFTPLATQVDRAAFLPPADVTVSDGDVVLTMDLPGVDAEQVELELVDGHLIVRGERVRPQLAEDTRYAHTERGFGRFERRIEVPRGVDPEKVTASMDNGVLSILVPKPDRLVPRTIQIGSANGQRRLESSAA